MNRVVESLVVGSILAILSFAVGGCQNQTISSLADPGLVVPKTSSGKMTRLLLGMQEKAVSAVSKYVQIPEETQSRSLGYGSLLVDVGELLPSDLSTLKRKVKTDSRGTGESDTISLQTELDSLVQEFNSEVDNLLPDPTAAKTLPYVKIDSDRISVSDDESVLLRRVLKVFFSWRHLMPRQMAKPENLYLLA